MTVNQYVKPLKPFDPKKDLLVNEKFKLQGSYSRTDTLSDLESDELDQGPGEDAGKESASLKTEGPVYAGIIKIDNSLNRTILLAANKSGEVILLSPEGNALKPLLKFKIQGSIIRTPAYSDGIIYCATREGMIYAINTNLKNAADIKSIGKPQILWKERADKGILTEPLATGKTLIIATLGGIYAYEAYYQDESNKSIGKRLWNTQLNGTVSTPKIHSGNIYIGTEDNLLIAFEYGGGNVNQSWAYKTSGPVRVKPCVSKNEMFILFTTIDGFLYCITRDRGEYKWNFVTRAPSYSSVVSAVIGNKEYFYFGADNGLFYCIDSMGKKVWEFRANGKIRSEAVIHGQRIFFGAEDNNLYGLNLMSGEKVFKFSTDGNIASSPIIIENIAYFGSGDSFVRGVYI